MLACPLTRSFPHFPPLSALAGSWLANRTVTERSPEDLCFGHLYGVERGCPDLFRHRDDVASSEWFARSTMAE
jgi:hypothetical protein